MTFHKITPVTKRAVRKRWNTRERREKAERRHNLEAVRVWWRDRVEDGHPLQRKGYEPGIDYIGEGWPLWVSLTALFKDFVDYTGSTWTKQMFVREFRAIAVVADSMSRSRRIENEGRVIAIRNITYYKVLPP